MTDPRPLSFRIVEGHRRYADEPEPHWYSGQSQHPNPYDSGVHERPSGAFRLPDERDKPDPVTSTGSHARPQVDQPHDQTRVPVRGPEYPTIRPTGATSLADAPPPATYGTPAGGTVAAYNDPTSVVPPVSRYQPEPRQKKSMYRTKRPVAAIGVAIVTLVLMIPAIMLLVEVSFNGDPVASGIVPAVLLTLGLPLSGAGLYALAADGPTGREAWLRTPFVYLPVGLVVLLAAGLAVA
jgi:hypothetical protein